MQMQAITISIGKAGVDFFVHKLLADQIVQLLGGLTPPNRTIQVPGVIKYRFNPARTGYLEALNIVIQLSQGKLNNFTPTLQSITQQDKGVFMLTVASSGAFSAQYQWDESYDEQDVYDNQHTDIGQQNKTFSFSPAFSYLNTQIPLVFSFDATKNAWVLATSQVSADPDLSQPNIPPHSILQSQSAGDCYGTQVSQATAHAIGAIDFASAIDALVQKTFASIPGSGKLGDHILYDFSLGASGLVFPDDNGSPAGIQMGVAGGASYNGTPFSGGTPPQLPLPAPLAETDTHHLNMYVSNYEINALLWAFTQAGKLNLTVSPTDLPDPAVLKVATYVRNAKALAPYQYFNMQAQVTQNSAPVTNFQLVYIFTKAVVDFLKNNLSKTAFNLVNSYLVGNSYTSASSLEANLTAIGINGPNDITIIENAAKTIGLVVNHNINFKLVILTPASPQPEIEFNITREDILTNLALGINASQAQTMQFGFTNVTWNSSFVSSSIPDFNGSDLGSVWGQAGEPGYETILSDLGKTGTPVPIMEGFQFDFENAVLSLQEGYVSILANVVYKN